MSLLSSALIPTAIHFTLKLQAQVSTNVWTHNHEGDFKKYLKLSAWIYGWVSLPLSLWTVLSHSFRELCSQLKTFTLMRAETLLGKLKVLVASFLCIILLLLVGFFFICGFCLFCFGFWGFFARKSFRSLDKVQIKRQSNIGLHH